jgi:hypothetical protein
MLLMRLCTNQNSKSYNINIFYFLMTFIAPLFMHFSGHFYGNVTTCYSFIILTTFRFTKMHFSCLQKKTHIYVFLLCMVIVIIVVVIRTSRDVSRFCNFYLFIFSPTHFETKMIKKCKKKMKKKLLIYS